jgi:ABC-type multidrug transport system ATPase subunit
MEYPYTSLTQKQRQDQIRVRYMSAIINIISIALFIGMVGVTYQLTGLIAMERELGMSQLIDCMLPGSSQWKAQAARFIAAHLALDIIYGPGWIITGIILKYGVFSKTSAGITVVNHLLTGLALSSFSIFGASFFRKAQLSGISVVIANLLLGVVAQVAGIKTNGAVVVLGLLFPSMNYVFLAVFMARWERQNQPTNLVHAAPDNPWTIPGIALWVLLIVQIMVYPVLAAFVERMLYGTASSSREITALGNSSALTIDGFSKEYKPSWFHRNVAKRFGSKRQSVFAVNNLSLDVVKGEIMVLLGANGSGKSTTLDAISGLTKISSGEIKVDYGNNEGGFGLCPQKNVLWHNLTVKEHVKIFNGLKTVHKRDGQDTLMELIADCDLQNKPNAQSRTLSGGQKRKLQLAIMFTGGSTVCCVDEVSSGLDPISRRKIWDILLAERGRRTILFTTHFLDEAELLADHIAILSKGFLEAQGSTVELKHHLGSGYRVHVHHPPGSTSTIDLQLEGTTKETQFDETVYTVQDSALVSRIVAILEKENITEYRISGPTIEDVFLKVAQDLSQDSEQPEKDDTVNEKPKSEDTTEDIADSTPQLLTGKRIGMARQTWFLYVKRLTILRRNYIPYIAAFLIPVIAAGLVTLFLKDATAPKCSGDSLFMSPDPKSLSSYKDIDLVVGPQSQFSSALGSYISSLSGLASSESNNLSSYFNFVDSYPDFTKYIETYQANITPGGIWLGDSFSKPTFAWKGNNNNFLLAALTQNAMNNLLSNTPIGFQYQSFDIPWQSDVGKMLQLLVYFGLASAVYPALFALYPTIERLRNVRALHYSNGVRPLPLWLAYLCFDFCIVLLASVLGIIIFRAASDVWYHAEYLFVVFFLYGLCSTILSYLVSLVAKSQLAAFAFAAGMQCVFFLIYFIGYMSVLTYAPTAQIDSYLSIVHFTLSIIMPIGSLSRAMFAALNIFSILCRGQELASYPGDITVYGGPILYLIVQSIILFGLLLWFDGGGNAVLAFRSKSKPEDVEEKEMDEDVANELSRVTDSQDGLRVLHLTKSFKKFVAVEDVTFGVGRGEVFALLGPNGAGKTTTISLIRGDIQPSERGGDIFVENVSVTKNRAIARSNLGVCPQFDAMDQMTVIEHLRFYAQIRGISDVDHNVRQVIRAVGLGPFQHRMAMKLSGGNKRKLSLGIALMGNPAVLLLDEPSSGMDAASKRVMWKTLAAVAPGRSIVLTTHSMEEADALASRAGIMAKRMLALGTTDYLRSKYGNMYHVHLVHSQAPHTSDEDMGRMRTWVHDTFHEAMVESKTYHGQLRFSVPTESSSAVVSKHEDEFIVEDEINVDLGRDGQKIQSSTVSKRGNGGIGNLFSCLEANKEVLGVQYYSVSQTSLDQVFLTIVGKHNIEEENSGTK